MTSADGEALGRRAVFAAPPVRATDGRDHPDHPDHPVRSTGKHALFSGADPSGPDPGYPTGPDPAGTYAAGTPGPSGSPDAGGTPTGSGWFVVGCSSCHTATRVGLPGLVRLAFPVGVWLPGRRYDHWMACPACGRRTWVGITLAR